MVQLNLWIYFFNWRIWFLMMIPTSTKVATFSLFLFTYSESLLLDEQCVLSKCFLASAVFHCNIHTVLHNTSTWKLFINELFIMHGLWIWFTLGMLGTPWTLHLLWKGLCKRSKYTISSGSKTYQKGKCFVGLSHDRHTLQFTWRVGNITTVSASPTLGSSTSCGPRDHFLTSTETNKKFS